MNRSRHARGVLITGAGSGIGAALCREWADRCERLFICARDEARLNAVADSVRDAGFPRPECRIVDVTDEAAMREWIFECDRKTPLDIIHANAGVSTGVECEANVRNTFSINVNGVLNTVLPAMEIMRADRSRKCMKRIAITSSIAGYHGLSGCPSYSATKACVKAWGAGLRGFLAAEGIGVNVICPGFVRSRITDKNTCPMPFFMEAPKAAKIIVDGVVKNRPIVAFPFPMRFASWVISILPERISELIFAALPKKSK